MSKVEIEVDIKIDLALVLIGVHAWRVAKFYPFEYYFMERWLNPQFSHYSTNPTLISRCEILL